MYVRVRTIVPLVMIILIICPIPTTKGNPAPAQVFASWPTETWTRSPPNDQGVNASVLENMIDYFSKNNIGIDSVAIVRNGYLLLEEYLSRYGRNDTHHLFSVTKSITATLIGIAEKEGFVESLDETMLSYFPDMEIDNLDEDKESITIHDMLTMSAGLDWNEEHVGSAINDYQNMIRSDDWVQYVLDKPVVSHPGEEFKYNSGLSHLLSVILQNSTGVTPLEFAEEYLFSKLGISDYSWDTDPSGVNQGGSKLKLRPLDMAKIGYLFLKNGLWNGTQILPVDWIKTTSTTLFEVDDGTGYSYHWWTIPELDAYYALGWGFQSITVLPDYDLVVVVTAQTLHESADVHYILNKWILPSMGIAGSLSIPSFIISPIAVFIASSPFLVVLIVYVWERRGLWEE